MARAHTATHTRTMVWFIFFDLMHSLSDWLEACFRGDIETITELSGTYLGQVDEAGACGLTYALRAACPSVGVIELLLEESRTLHKGATPLIQAIQNRCPPPVIDLLITDTFGLRRLWKSGLSYSIGPATTYPTKSENQWSPSICAYESVCANTLIDGLLIWYPSLFIQYRDTFKEAGILTRDYEAQILRYAVSEGIVDVVSAIVTPATALDHEQGHLLHLASEHFKDEYTIRFLLGVLPVAKWPMCDAHGRTPLSLLLEAMVAQEYSNLRALLRISDIFAFYSFTEVMFGARRMLPLRFALSQRMPQAIISALLAAALIDPESDNDADRAARRSKLQLLLSLDVVSCIRDHYPACFLQHYDLLRSRLRVGQLLRLYESKSLADRIFTGTLLQSFAEEAPTDLCKAEDLEDLLSYLLDSTEFIPEGRLRTALDCMKRLTDPEPVALRLVCSTVKHVGFISKVDALLADALYELQTLIRDQMVATTLRIFLESYVRDGVTAQNILDYFYIVDKLPLACGKPFSLAAHTKPNQAFARILTLGAPSSLVRHLFDTSEVKALCTSADAWRGDTIMLMCTAYPLTTLSLSDWEVLQWFAAAYRADCRYIEAHLSALSGCVNADSETALMIVCAESADPNCIAALSGAECCDASYVPRSPSRIGRQYQGELAYTGLRAIHFLIASGGAEQEQLMCLESEFDAECTDARTGRVYPLLEFVLREYFYNRLRSYDDPSAQGHALPASYWSGVIMAIIEHEIAVATSSHDRLSVVYTHTRFASLQIIASLTHSAAIEKVLFRLGAEGWFYSAEKGELESLLSGAALYSDRVSTLGHSGLTIFLLNNPISSPNCETSEAAAKLAEHLSEASLADTLKALIYARALTDVHVSICTRGLLVPCSDGAYAVHHAVACSIPEGTIRLLVSFDVHNTSAAELFDAKYSAAFLELVSVRYPHVYSSMLSRCGAQGWFYCARKGYAAELASLGNTYVSRCDERGRTALAFLLESSCAVDADIIKLLSPELLVRGADGRFPLCKLVTQRHSEETVDIAIRESLAQDSLIEDIFTSEAIDSITTRYPTLFERHRTKFGVDRWFAAAIEADAQLVQSLHRKYAGLTDSNKRTALMLACIFHRPGVEECIPILAQGEAGLVDESGNTALYYLIVSGSLSSTSIFKDYLECEMSMKTSAGYPIEALAAQTSISTAVVCEYVRYDIRIRPLLICEKYTPAVQTLLATNHQAAFCILAGWFANKERWFLAARRTDFKTLFALRHTYIRSRVHCADALFHRIAALHNITIADDTVGSIANEPEGWTALMVLCSHSCDTDCLAVLADEAGMRTDDGVSALHLAAAARNLTVALIKALATEISFRCERYGYPCNAALTYESPDDQSQARRASDGEVTAMNALIDADLQEHTLVDKKYTTADINALSARYPLLYSLYKGKFGATSWFAAAEIANVDTLQELRLRYIGCLNSDGMTALSVSLLHRVCTMQMVFILREEVSIRTRIGYPIQLVTKIPGFEEDVVSALMHNESFRPSDVPQIYTISTLARMQRLYPFSYGMLQNAVEEFREDGWARYELIGLDSFSNYQSLMESELFDGMIQESSATHESIALPRRVNLLDCFYLSREPKRNAGSAIFTFSFTADNGSRSVVEVKYSSIRRLHRAVVRQFGTLVVAELPSLGSSSSEFGSSASIIGFGMSLEGYLDTLYSVTAISHSRLLQDFLNTPSAFTGLKRDYIG